MIPRTRTLALALVVFAVAVVFLLWRDEKRPVTERKTVVANEASASAPQPPALPMPSAAAALPVASASSTAQGRPSNEDAYMHELMQLESTDKEAALALAQKGDDWYPSTGRPAEARKAMIVTLLADLNRMDEARSLARAFMAAFPRSEYLPLVQGATGIHPRPHGPNGVLY
ncbi:MAG TPA: hypothetical protein VHC69_16675 [Polyangiaceae bacterium]|nr:hypothetical protein [Polyangiaceae bacterium]